MKRYSPLYIEKFKDTGAFEKFVKNFKDTEIRNGEEYTIFTRSVHPSTLFEAVIRVDDYVKLLKSKIDAFYKVNKNKYTNSDDILKALNKEFSTFDFIFEKDNFKIDEDPEHSGINDTDTGSKKDSDVIDVLFSCNKYISNILVDVKSFEKFKEHFIQLSEHELIHRGQLLRIKTKELRAKVANRKDTVENQFNYYKHIHEIMAYSKVIIEELRFGGFTDKEILGIIRNGEDRLSDIFDNYLKLYKKDKVIVLNRLYKYMYEYLQ